MKKIILTLLIVTEIFANSCVIKTTHIVVGENTFGIKIYDNISEICYDGTVWVRTHNTYGGSMSQKFKSNDISTKPQLIKCRCEGK